MEKSPIPIVIVAAIEKTSRAIGYQNRLLWHIPDDLKRFKALTLGQPIIMGRNTYASIIEMLGKPLPGRTTIVLTRNAQFEPGFEDVRTATSLEAALALAEAESPEAIHIGGGAELYQAALPFVTRLHLTLVDDPTAIGDTFFPAFEDTFTPTHAALPAQHDGITYQWVDYERTKPS